MKGNINALLGQKGEKLIEDIFNDISSESDIVKKISTVFNHKNQIIDCSAKRVGYKGKKTDVILKFQTKTGFYTHKASVKSFKDAGFNQILRTKIDAFTSEFNISEHNRFFKEVTINWALKNQTNG
ncbi:MAG: hypothetical protein OXC64_04905 [Flavobacteriaceae bacterium]|nr:hypothetical protein [Flavobacteriaceae bacterium]